MRTFATLTADRLRQYFDSNRLSTLLACCFFGFYLIVKGVGNSPSCAVFGRECVGPTFWTFEPFPIALGSTFLVAAWLIKRRL